MLLRLVVCIGMVIFCVWQGFVASSVPIESGDHYFPGVYLFCIIILSMGLNKFGLMSWPVATLLLLLRGHWVVGWIPLAFVVFTVLGNKMLDRNGEPAKED